MDKESDKFLEDFAQKPVDILEAPLTSEQVVTPAPTDDEPEPPRNRRERRLEEKLQAERESSRFMAGRLEALTEAQKFQHDLPDGEHIKAIERIYGNDTPEAKQATELLRTALLGVEKTATEKALQTFRDEQRKQADEVATEEKTLDNMVDDIEDTYGVDMTDTMRQAFFQRLEKLSHKDRDGNITEYADHNAVWEDIQERIKKPVDTRAKDLSSRSMTPSGASKDTKLIDDSAVRFLKENGII